MNVNLYEKTASFYDLGNTRSVVAADLDFYLKIIAPEENVLEVGCGTGRVALALAERGNLVTGIDLSQSMLDVFKGKIAVKHSVAKNISLHRMDMRDFDLGRTFDWILFPFRVFQALTSTEDRLHCLAAMRRHMSVESRAILTLFNPKKAILDNWGAQNILDFENIDDTSGRTVRRYQDQLWHDSQKQIIAAQFRHEVFEEQNLVESPVDQMELGYLYPWQCCDLFESSSLAVEHAFGDYDQRPLNDDEQKEQIYVLKIK